MVQVVGIFEQIHEVFNLSDAFSPGASMRGALGRALEGYITGWWW